MSRIMTKPVFGVFGKVRHKPCCTVTEDDWMLEMRILDVEGLYYLCSKNRGDDLLHGFGFANA